MEYQVEDIEGTFNTEVVKQLGGSEFVIKINDKEKNLKILNLSPAGIEFILNQQYHNVKYLDKTTSSMKVVVDGTPITLNMHHKLDEIVYKHSGGAGAQAAQTLLHSQIPGKVVSIEVKEGDNVKQGDIICVLESMKMQVSVKSHKDGVVKKINIKQGGSVAKNDVIAEIE